MPNPPALSIVTAVRDGAAGLPTCLASVAAQDVPCEHIVVDGGSRDGTVGILRSWQHDGLVWSSEPDQGISDAFNKGIARATGVAILMLGSDDRLVPGAAARLLAALEASPDAAFCFGHCLHREHDGREWLNRGDPCYWKRLRLRMPDVNHATMAIRRSAYDRVGGYDLRWRFAMDYDWLLRAETAGMRGRLVEAELAERDMGGVSDRHWIRANAEVRAIAIAHGAARAGAWADFLVRVGKGMVRRGMVRAGMTGVEGRVRTWLQERTLKSG